MRLLVSILLVALAILPMPAWAGTITIQSLMAKQFKAGSTLFYGFSSINSSVPVVDVTVLVNGVEVPDITVRAVPCAGCAPGLTTWIFSKAAAVVRAGDRLTLVAVDRDGAFMPRSVSCRASASGSVLCAFPP